MKLFNWKSNTNPNTDQETPTTIETPLTNPALKEIPDHYGQVQAEADEKRMYLQAQKHNMPKSYFQQIAGTRRLLALYVSTFPYLSFATLLALLYFATGLDALISGVMGAQGYFLAIAAMVGGGLLIGINETIKSRKVPHVMRGQVNGWRIMNRDRFAVAITVFLSISGSAAGGYLLTSTLLDDSKTIQAGHHQTNKQIQSAFQADSLAITADYGSEIASLTRELEKYDTGAGTKACDNCTFWRGKWVIPDKIKPRKAELGSQTLQPQASTKKCPGRCQDCQSIPTASIFPKPRSTDRNQRQRQNRLWLDCLCCDPGYGNHEPDRPLEHRSNRLSIGKGRRSLWQDRSCLRTYPHRSDGGKNPCC